MNLVKRNEGPATLAELDTVFTVGVRAYFTHSWQFVKCNRDTARAVASKCITKGYYFHHKVCDHNDKFHMFIMPAAIDFTHDIVGKSKFEFVASVIPGEHMTQDKYTGKSAC